MFNRRIALAVTIVALIGCSAPPPPMPESAPISGSVVDAGGKPIKNVIITLQPMETGHPVEMEVNDKGEFTGEAVPAKFMFYFAPSKKVKSTEGMKQIPQNYQSPNVEHFVQVKAGEAIQVKLQ